MACSVTVLESLAATIFTFKMEAMSSRTLVSYSNITWHYNFENDMDFHCCENLRLTSD
jgi:hypothetical protein